jgi:hypothetical protein
MRFGLGAIGTVLFVMVIGGSAIAESPAAEPPVAFVEAEPLAVSCPVLAGAGVQISIRNETAVRQKVRISVALTRKNGRTIRSKSVCGGLKLTPRKRSLAPGRGAMVTLAASNAARKGSFSGTLAIYGSRGRVARRELTISSVPPSPADLAATPLVPNLSIELHTGDKGPIWVPVAGSTAALPPAGSGEGDEKAATVGALSGPGDPVGVSYSGESKVLGAGASQVGLRLEGDLSPGTWSGEVDLAPDDELGPVTLEVKVSKDWLWAALALFAGILLGILLLRVSGRTLPKARLLGRVEGLARRHQDATDALGRAAGGTAPWKDIQIEDFEALQQQLRDKIGEATKRRRVLVKIEKSVLDSIEAAILVVETQIDLLREVPKHARPLEAVLLLPRAEHLPPLPKAGPQAGPPLEAEAEALFAKKVTAEELKPRLEQMDSHVKPIGMLRKLEADLEELWLRWQKLEQEFDGGTAEANPLPKIEKALIDRRRRLWSTSDVEGLQGVGKQIESTEDELSAIELKAGESHQPPITRRFLAKGSFSGSEQLETLKKIAGANVVAQVEAAVSLAAIQPAAPASVPPARPPSQLTEDAADTAIRRALQTQFFVVLAAAALAIASGLIALYVGKTWGTTWDVVAAIAWGTAAQAVVTTLVTSLDDFGALASLRRR